MADALGTFNIPNHFPFVTQKRPVNIWYRKQTSFVPQPTEGIYTNLTMRRWCHINGKKFFIRVSMSTTLNAPSKVQRPRVSPKLYFSTIPHNTRDVMDVKSNLKCIWNDLVHGFIGFKCFLFILMFGLMIYFWLYENSSLILIDNESFTEILNDNRWFGFI